MMFSHSKYPVKKHRTTRFLSVGDAKAGKTLILLHGMFGGLSNFDLLLNQMDSKEYRIVVPQLPLFSTSVDVTTIQQLTQWLVEFMDKLDIAEAHLLGNSMGGHIAIDVALRYPDRIQTLILTGSSGLIENGIGASRPRRFDRDYIREQAETTFYEDLVDEQMVDEIEHVLASPEKLKKIIHFARDTHHYNVETLLPQIKTEVLLIWGRNDVITPPSVALKFQQKLPNSTLHWIDCCGHAPMMEKPKEFVRLLTDFLQSYTAANQ